MKARKLLYQILSSLLVFFALVGVAVPAHSQQSGVFQVLLWGIALDLEIPDSGGRTTRDVIGTLTAFADGERCTSLDLIGGTGDEVLELGLPGQPDACSRNGAAVTFWDSRGRTLNESMTLVLGTQKQLASFSIPPPTFDVVVPATAGAEPLPNLNGRMLRTAISPLTAYVDGEECLTFDISEPEEVIASLGQQGQSPPCFADEGSIVTFRNAQGQWLNAWFTFERGTQVTLSNFAPTPPCSPGSCPTPGPSQTPTASTGASPGSSTITPPDTGSAGLR
jgi:hypothetical protein